MAKRTPSQSDNVIYYALFRNDGLSLISTNSNGKPTDKPCLNICGTPRLISTCLCNVMGGLVKRTPCLVACDGTESTTPIVACLCATGETKQVSMVYDAVGLSKTSALQDKVYSTYNEAKTAFDKLIKELPKDLKNKIIISSIPKPTYNITEPRWYIFTSKPK
jgi:hypothetical protein